ncbi:MAG: EAL domain-containing protein [Lachnospiraceae bacterium]|nr:EAL domain-containing protein [Lachnospiraceae bacterium]
MNGKRYIKNLTIFCSLIPAIVLGILGYTFISIETNKNFLKNLEESVSTYQTGFLTKLEMQKEKVDSLSLTNEVGNLLLDSLNCLSIQELKELDKSKVTKLLVEASSEYGDCIEYSLYTSEGTFLTGSSSIKNSLKPEECEAAYQESSISLSQDSGSLRILSPIISHETTVGYLSADISSEYFKEFLTKSNDDKIINTFLATKQGEYVLLTSEDNTKNYTISTQQLKQIYADYYTNQITSGTTSFRSIGKSMLSAYSIIPEYEWVFVANTPHLTISDFSHTILLLFVCYIILTAFVSYKLGKRFANTIFKPVSDLNEAMDAFISNKPDYQYENDSFEEFKQLSSSYQLLAASISKKNVIYSKMYEAFISNEEEIKEEYSHVAKLAYRDALTGLNNRLAFMNYAEEIIKDSNQSTDHHAILFIDLDNFKNVNDTLGHDYGDNLLKQISASLSSFTKEGDILARTGGDEFLFFKKNIESEHELSDFCSSLLNLSRIPIQINEETLMVSMSIGIARYPDNGITVKELVKNADIAMYTAKSQGRNDFRFFNSTMESEINRKKEVIEILREAIKNHDLYLVYQPQASVHTGIITGYEALMRLENPVLGFISPAEFIPIAEECGLIRELGDWALYEACRFNKKIMDQGYKNIVVSVNISPTQLIGDSLVHVVQDVLEKTGLPPELLELEITESILMDSIDHNLYIIDCIKAMGVKIALDDFGTGYSSLNYLTRIPINTLKIDKSFIDRIVVNAKDEYIADTIITLAHKMDIAVIAEGVEEIEQLKILQEQMCDILQGYFFSKPLLEKDFEKLLAENCQKIMD